MLNNEIVTAITIETNRAIAAEANLATNLNTEITNRGVAVTSVNTSLNLEITTLGHAVTNETARATAAETALTSNLNTVSGNLDTEIAARGVAVTSVNTSLNLEITARVAAVTALTSNLNSEIARATTAETAVTSNLNSEIAARGTAVTAVTSNLNSEIANRKIATPIGFIVAWSGTIAPAGFGLCNGGIYTRSDAGGSITAPDLRGRFILGQGQGTGLTNRVLATTGGAETVVLATANLPAHNHAVTDPGHFHTNTDYYFGTYNNCWGSGACSGGNTGYSYSQTLTTSTKLTGISIQNTGSGTAVPIMPPFYALAFIMKI